MNDGFRVVAILAAYNEADILGQAVDHLLTQGIDIYYIDDGSTDESVRVIEPHLGKGVLSIESFAEPADSAGGPRFRWEEILRRKEQLALDLDADWFIHQDADEFRESPWRDRTLREAIQLVDRAGYDAIDFELLNFVPTSDTQASDDPRDAFRYFEPARPFDRLQVRSWKKTTARVNLTESGGHDVQFDGRRVFPIRFLLRHYPIRSQAHGERKVFADRRPRLLPEEHARRWHIQYDHIEPGHSFVADPSALTLFDADLVRLGVMLRHRDVEALERGRAEDREQIVALERNLADLRSRADAQTARAETLAQQSAELQTTLHATMSERDLALEKAAEGATHVARLQGQLADVSRELRGVSHRHEALRRDHEDVSRDLLAARDRVDGLLSSFSWRVTAPLRALARLLRLAS